MISNGFCIIFRLACRSCYLDVMLLQDPALNLGLRYRALPGERTDKEVEEEKEEVWRRPHKPLFLCKIASSLISNCVFTGNEFPKRLKFSLCWYVTASSLPKLFKLLRVDMRKHRLGFKTKQNTKKTLRMIIQLQDTCWTNTSERRPLKSN